MRARVCHQTLAYQKQRVWECVRVVLSWKSLADLSTQVDRVVPFFVDLCRQLGLLSVASVAIDGSKFKAVNNRDRNFTRGNPTVLMTVRPIFALLAWHRSRR